MILGGVGSGALSIESAGSSGLAEHLSALGAPPPWVGQGSKLVALHPAVKGKSPSTATKAARAHENQRCRVRTDGHGTRCAGKQGLQHDQPWLHPLGGPPC